jgi:hypothetical protein
MRLEMRSVKEVEIGLPDKPEVGVDVEAVER